MFSATLKTERAREPSWHQTSSMFRSCSTSCIASARGTGVRVGGTLARWQSWSSLGDRYHERLPGWSNQECKMNIFWLKMGIHTYTKLRNLAPKKTTPPVVDGVITSNCCSSCFLIPLLQGEMHVCFFLTGLTGSLLHGHGYQFFKPETLFNGHLH